MVNGIKKLAPVCGKKIVFFDIKETFLISLNVGNGGGVL
jgi:hypothetical protein